MRVMPSELTSTLPAEVLPVWTVWLPLALAFWVFLADAPELLDVVEAYPPPQAASSRAAASTPEARATGRLAFEIFVDLSRLLG